MPDPSEAAVPGPTLPEQARPDAAPAAAPPPPDGGRRRVFLHLLGNTLVASVVNFTVWFAVTFWVYLETRSVFATGVISGIYLVFTTASGVWFGGLVDRHPKRAVMLGSSVVSLLCYSAALALYLLTEPASFTDPGEPGAVGARPAADERRDRRQPAGDHPADLVTMLVPADGRDRANGLVGTTNGASFLVTSVISGLLVGLSGMFYALLVAVAVTAAVIVHLAVIRIPGDRAAATRRRRRRSAPAGPARHDRRGRGASRACSASSPSPRSTTSSAGCSWPCIDAYGLSLVSVQVVGAAVGVLSAGVHRRRPDRRPRAGWARTRCARCCWSTSCMWTVTSVFTLRSSILLLAVGMFVWLCLVPFAEAAEQTVLQKVVPFERQGRVFGFAQSVEMAASPLTAFLISPIAQFVAIPFMTTGRAPSDRRLVRHRPRPRPRAGVHHHRPPRPARHPVAFRTPPYRRLSHRYQEAPATG